MSDMQDKDLDLDLDKGAAVDKDPILDNNRKLLGEVKAAKAAKRELEARLAEFEAEKQARETEEARKSGNFEKLEKDLKDRLSKVEQDRNNLIIDTTLQSELNRANIKAEFKEAVAAMMKVKGISLNDDLSPSIQGKSLVDFFGEWVKSDEGKAFIAAPQSTGGGATGGGAAKNHSGGNMGGTKAERIAAINDKYLNK